MTPTTAPSHPHPADGPRRLVRTPDKKVAGVCAGIAHYLGIDPTIVRILFLLSAFLGGVGLLAYVVAWIVMPKGDAPTPGRVEPADAWTVLAVVAVAIGAAALFGWTGVTVLGGEALLGVLLIAGGVALLLRRPGPSAPPAAPGPPPPEAPPAGEAPAGAVPGETSDQPRSPDAAAPDSGRRGIVTAGTLSVLTLVAAALVAAALADWVDLSTSTVLAAALVIVGAGLVLAAVVGPAPWLFVVASLLTVALLVAATVEPWVEDGVGERTYAPLVASDVRARYALGIGDLEVDLGALDLARGTRTVEVAVGAGNAIVTVPRGVEVELRSHVGVGELVAPGGLGANGVDERLDATLPGAQGLLVLDLDVVFGRGEVRRGS